MRARLIAATRQSLMDHGYGRTTAVDVCRQAGVTRGALFHHFPDGLPALFAATLDEVCLGIGARARDAAAQAGASDALDAYIGASEEEPAVALLWQAIAEDGKTSVVASASA